MMEKIAIVMILFLYVIYHCEEYTCMFILYQEYISGKATLACIHCLHFQHDALCRPEHFFLHPVLDKSQSTDSTRNSVSYASSYSPTHLQSSRICT